MPATLNEFVMYVKGWEYVVAIAFILSFILFWQAMTHQQQ